MIHCNIDSKLKMSKYLRILISFCQFDIQCKLSNQWAKHFTYIFILAINFTVPRAILGEITYIYRQHLCNAQHQMTSSLSITYYRYVIHHNRNFTYHLDNMRRFCFFEWPFSGIPCFLSDICKTFISHYWHT